MAGVALASLCAACGEGAPGVSRDLGHASDLAPRDLGAADIALSDIALFTDIAISPDMTISPDIAKPLDMANPLDIAISPDIAKPLDMANPLDLAVPDLAVPDLAVPLDMAIPRDIAIPLDFKLVFDLASTDLAHTCPGPQLADTHAAERAACTFAAGARVADTLGVTPFMRAAIPLTHLIIVTQENRSFDHFFGRLPVAGQPDADGWPANFTNPDKSSVAVSPFHLTSPTLPADPPHQGAAMSAGWNSGAMDGFVRSAAVNGSDGHFVMGYYDNNDLPFFYWAANTFSVADRYFASALGGTWANRDYLYTGTSDGVLDTGSRTISKPTIFDSLDTAGVAWGVYSNGLPRQDCLGWTSTHSGFNDFPTFLAQLAAGTLPPIAFVDPVDCEDEHPTADVHGGEYWVRTLYEAALASPLWGELAVVLTFDEAGGLADHVPPPAACPPSADQSAFNRYGIRIGTIVMSPWARPHQVSHAVHDHTSVLRLIELMEDLPALTARDANADALLDLFDFQCPMTPPTAPASGGGACN